MPPPRFPAGMTGHVQLITHRETKEVFALKAMDMELVSSVTRQQALALCQRAGFFALPMGLRRLRPPAAPRSPHPHIPLPTRARR